MLLPVINLPARSATKVMANRHFAELGDVWKHLPLAEVLRLNPPQHYWETHAGSLCYPLTASPTRVHGALRFLKRAALDPDLIGCAYLAALQAEVSHGWHKIKSLEAELSHLREAKMRSEQRLQHQVQACETSWSFRLGRAITWPLRTLLGMQR